jgi:hypothetical protein
MNSNHRSNYRKNLKVSGTLVSGEDEISFFTKNVSLHGFEAYCEDAKALEKGDMVYLRLPPLNMEGVASLVWTERADDGFLHFGFKFMNMRGVDGSSYHYRDADQEESEE